MTSERDLCPICCEAIGAADKRFKPCSCGFQICIWCYRKIEESEKALCPKCRRQYTGRFTLNPLTAQTSSDENEDENDNDDDGEYDNEQRATFRENPEDEDNDSDGEHSQASSGLSSQRRPANTRGSPSKEQLNLKDVRVVRRDLCYVVGMPLETVSDETKLKSFEYFGKYGRVVNIIVNRNPNFKSPDKRKSCAVYITFSNRDEAKAAIMDLDDALYESRRLRASYGTTKYCSSFLKGCRCQNRTCFYLHERGADEDSFTVDQLNQVKESSRGLTCSTLLASEFQDAASWKRDACLFGKDKKMTLAYFMEDEFGRSRPPLPNMMAEITQLRKKAATTLMKTTSLQARPPPIAALTPAVARCISLVVLPPPPSQADFIVHPALQPMQSMPSLHLGLPHASSHCDAFHDLRALGLDLSGSAGEVIVPTSLPASAPSRLIQSFRVTPADQMARAKPDMAHTHVWDPPPGFNRLHSHHDAVIAGVANGEL